MGSSRRGGAIALPLDETNEKYTYIDNGRCRDRRSKKRLAGHVLFCLLVLANVWVVRAMLKSKTPKTPDDGIFQWDQLPTLPELEYKPCYKTMQCARLELPMDYWNGTTSATISLAVLKVPATVPVTDARYRGPVLLNPGGPGGSGVSFAFGAGEKLAAIVSGTWPDMEKPRFYDMIGFDPRGVALTLPRVTCTGNSSMSQSWATRVVEEGTWNSSDAAFGRLWAMQNAMSGHCSDVGDDSIQRYMSTAYVARDMIELVEASARLQNKQLKAAGSDQLVEVEKAMLQYWGFSYGSVLGVQFAAMFPDRVGRLIVDGVVDIFDYVQSRWETNLVDTEKDWDTFAYYCAQAGYPACPLADRHNPSAEKVAARAAGIIKSMWHNPVPMLAPYADVVTWSDVRGMIFGGLYSPVKTFPEIARALAELEVGNSTTAAAWIKHYHFFTCGKPQPDIEHDKPTGETDSFTVAAVLCTDGPEKFNVTQDVYRETMDTLMSASPNFGDIWTSIPARCLNYNVRAEHRFAGPFEGNTANPVLFIGNTADPVTPLVNCMEVAKGFKDAVCLTQDSPGHCSVAAYSLCTHKYVADYFANATMPEPGATCDADIWPWKEETAMGIMSVEDKAKHDFSRELSAAHLLSGGMLGGVNSRIDHAALLGL